MVTFHCIWFKICFVLSETKKIQLQNCDIFIENGRTPCIVGLAQILIWSTYKETKMIGYPDIIKNTVPKHVSNFIIFWKLLNAK